ncbi:AAA family ATPase [Lactobacillus sp. ESL0684]|uniref:ATP-binding protein n=1 Tax=Lactobacillus sp. ESL0684 TaxID=2983213 RepID=UPI0023F82D5C|nr:AAA family ATPase [Lactobacillus sp. ESL0684]WEV44212.1 AAA family ATPase [Lactobacillus sp. ESL0684]
MKLIRIEIVNFGQFSNFTLAVPHHGLNVFFGANEAGKSTIVAFIKQIMFGFHLSKRTGPFFEDYKPLARVSPMGGSLFFEDEQGSHYELERLYASGKGSKLGTLTVKRDNQIVPESVFFDQLKNIDADFYAQSFIFNQDMLANVTNISQDELLERIYFLGAANSDQLIDQRNIFIQAASDLFKKGGSKPPINQLLKQLGQDRGQLAQAEQEFTDYQRLEAQLAEQTQLQDKTSTQLADLQAELGKVEQLQKLLPSYQKLQELKKQVKAVKFDQANYQTTQKLYLQQQSLQQSIKSVQTRLDELKGQPLAEDATKVLQQKAELLQWQSEYRNCQQKATEIATSKQQLLSLNPDLAAVAEFDQEQINNLQADYQKIPEKVKGESAVKDTGKNLLFGGAGLIALGIILLMFMPKVWAILAIVFGGASILLGLNQQKKFRVEQQIYKKQQANFDRLQADFLQKYHVDANKVDLANLLNDWRQYQLQKQNEQSNLQHMQEIDTQVASLAQQVSALLGQRVAASFTAVLTAFAQVEELVAKSQKQQATKASLAANLAESQAALHEAELKLQTNFAQANVKDLAEYDQLQQQVQNQATIKTEIAALTANLGSDLDQLEHLAQNQTVIAARQADLNHKFIVVQKELGQQQAKIAETKVKMTNLANSTAVFSAKQQLANTKTEFQRLSREYLANLSAAKWINRALDLASNERFPKMIIAAKEYLRLLTQNRYNNIEFSKKIAVTRNDGKNIGVQYLSRGTQEQLYFALKLAFTEQIKDQINLPILIDDSFVNFDEQRTKQIEQLLEQIARNNQVLIFTAQTKVAKQLQLQPLTFTKGTENV